jgi:hypothetical protein
MNRWLTMLVALSIAACNGCRSGGTPSAPAGVTMESLSVTSKTFASGAAIPVDNSCDGADRSPQLTWSAPPSKTAAYAIVADDPDAPGGDFTHWLAYDLPVSTLAVAEGADVASLGGTEGATSFGRTGYAGPCPPRREMHRYFFHVYALDAPLHLKAGAARDAVEAAMAHHVLAEGSVMGVFSH